MLGILDIPLFHVLFASQLHAHNFILFTSRYLIPFIWEAGGGGGVEIETPPQFLVLSLSFHFSSGRLISKKTYVVRNKFSLSVVLILDRFEFASTLIITRHQR